MGELLVSGRVTGVRTSLLGGPGPVDGYVVNNHGDRWNVP